MAHCAYCGAAIEPGAQFCLNCGSAVPAEAAQPVAQQPYLQQPPQQNYYQQPYTPQPPQQNYYQQPQYGSPLNQAGMPMNWFKFIIYFQLFASCVLNVISGFVVLTGSHYGGDAEAVYRIFSGLQTADILYGLMLLGIAVFAIVVRTRLAKFSSNGPKMYLGFLGASIVIPIIYLVAANMAISESYWGRYVELDYTSPSVNIATSVILLCCNVAYFNKRKHLFVNP